MLVGETTGGGFEHSEGIKHTVLFFNNNKLTITKQKLLIHALFFSLVCLSILSTHNSINLAAYLYSS